MIYSASQLKLILLNDLKPGTLASLVGREDDVPLFIRLANDEATKNPVIMPLGGDYAFHAIPWSVNDYARIICSVGDLRYRLNGPLESVNLRGAGVLTLHDNGACIGRAPLRGALAASPIDVETWSPLKSSSSQEALQSFIDWDLGRVLPNGDFQSLYKRSSSNKEAK